LEPIEGAQDTLSILVQAQPQSLQLNLWNLIVIARGTWDTLSLSSWNVFQQVEGIKASLEKWLVSCILQIKGKIDRERFLAESGLGKCAGCMKSETNTATDSNWTDAFTIVSPADRRDTQIKDIYEFLGRHSADLIRLPGSIGIEKLVLRCGISQNDSSHTDFPPDLRNQLMQLGIELVFNPGHGQPSPTSTTRQLE
jgi:hypothetical protein